MRFRRGRLHQRRPRSPRLSLHVGGLSRGQGPSHRPCRRRRRQGHREDGRPEPGRRELRTPGAPRHPAAMDLRLDHRVGPPSPRPGDHRHRLALSNEDAGRGDGGHAARPGAIQHLQRPLRRGRVPGAGRAGRRHRARPGRFRRCARPPRAGRSRPGLPRLHRLRARGGLACECPRRAAAFHARPADRGVRIDGALRPRPSGHGTGRGRVLGLLHHHHRRSAVRGPGRDRARRPVRRRRQSTGS